MQLRYWIEKPMMQTVSKVSVHWFTLREIIKRISQSLLHGT